MVIVDIGRTVDYETLEKALLEAAKEVGLQAEVEDKHRTRYKLGSVQRIQEYARTEIALTSEEILQMTLFIYNKVSPKGFDVLTSPFFGRASDEEVSKYLEAVSSHLTTD